MESYLYKANKAQHVDSTLDVLLVFDIYGYPPSGFCLRRIKFKFNSFSGASLFIVL